MEMVSKVKKTYHKTSLSHTESSFGSFPIQTTELLFFFDFPY